MRTSRTLSARLLATVALACLIGTALPAAPGPTGPTLGTVTGVERPHEVLVQVEEPAASTPRTGTAAPAARLRAGASGYTLAVPGLAGVTPTGLDVWVRPGTPHAGHIAGIARAVVRQWRSLGIPATFRGWGTPAAAEGVVTVAESRKGCGGGRAGVAWQRWRALPNSQYYVVGSRVYICPGLYRTERWQWSATVRHELGHAAGLGHFDRSYRGSTQVMRWQNAGGVSGYRAGDLNGLRYVARGSTRLTSLIPPEGALEGARIDPIAGTVRLDGWAVVTVDRDERAIIVVTDNGRRVSTAVTDVHRPDVNATHHPGSAVAHGFSVEVPWSRGTHEYCVEAVSPFGAAARSLGCSTSYSD